MKEENVKIKLDNKDNNGINKTSDKNIILLLKKSFENFIRIIIIISSLVFFCRNYFLLKSKTEIIIDNKIGIIKEYNIDFSNYNTSIKAIALFNQNILNIDETNDEEKNYFNNKILINKIENQINLAKNHGIYGFAFNYLWSHDEKVINVPLDLILSNQNLEIKFFLIFENINFLKSQKHNINKFINDIKKYMLDERYIKFNNKYIIGLINESLNENDINFFRDAFKENNIGEIFIISNANDININKKIRKNIYDGLYHSTSYESLEPIIYHFNNTYNYLYTHLLEANLNFPYDNNINNTSIFRTSLAISNYPMIQEQKNIKIYNDYTPNKFYFLNKIIIDWTKKYHKEDSQFIFIKGLNENFSDFSNLNYFSKAIYNIPLLNDIEYNITNLSENVFVLVQAHIFYVDLLQEIINKTNNILVPFDLYITTNTNENKIIIENYIKENSKANKYYVSLVENKGRDIIPFLTQVKDILLNYKYICHIHTKKHLGYNWRNYLYENLLGNANITSKILSDFENDEKLGLYFPEHYHQQTKFIYNWNHANAKQVNNIFKILFKNMNIKVGETLDFPDGNMFWARTKAIYQIFNNKIIELCPKENGQIDGTALHGIERIWLYLVKINGFYYKSNLYYLY